MSKLISRGGMAASLLCMLTSAAHACQACFGAEDTPLLDGARSGVWVLLAVTVTVQGGFAAFFIYLWRRSRRFGSEALRREWSQLTRVARQP